MVLAVVGLGIQEISTGSFQAVIFHIRATFGLHLVKTYSKVVRGHLQTMWTDEGGVGVPKMSMFVHMGGGGI